MLSTVIFDEVNIQFEEEHVLRLPPAVKDLVNYLKDDREYSLILEFDDYGDLVPNSDVWSRQYRDFYRNFYKDYMNEFINSDDISKLRVKILKSVKFLTPFAGDHPGRDQALILLPICMKKIEKPPVKRTFERYRGEDETTVTITLDIESDIYKYEREDGWIMSVDFSASTEFHIISVYKKVPRPSA
uniref:Uncharacterized protein n=1 Tax=Acrobeloides nanus TaxID=290746 RepID=A0A914E2T8_9BILA